MDDRIYYHALYHQLSHMAAFYLVFAALLTLIVVVSTTNKIDRLGVVLCCLVALALVLGSWFFLWRTSIYVPVVARMLPSDYLRELSGSLANPRMLILGGIAPLVVGAAVCLIAAKRSAKRLSR